MTDDIRKQTFLENTQQPTPNTHLPVPDTSQNNKRIAKNTLLLYVRMFFTMGVTLYTSRVVLNTLGVEDYGIYNVVGGIIAMFGFLNGAMSTATQRYLTFELGKGNIEGQRKVFNTSLQIHLLIAMLVFLFGETVGLWFIYTQMVIPPDRFDAALWVFQCSVLSMMVLIASVPFNASIIAHEKMSAFAYISIIEVILKLFIVYLLVISTVDKLKIYALLILSVQLLVFLIYRNYCNRRFSETKIIKSFDRRLFKEMTGFAGWNLWGNFAYILYTQGVNMLLNVFFGPVVNAARAVAVQVQGAILQFSANFQMAINPQITKTYAQGDLKSMHKLVQRSSRFTFMLLFVISLPVMIEAPFILELWLKTVPEHTVTFLRIILSTIIIDSMAQPLMQAAAATGRVRRYQSVVGGVLLTIAPIAYIVLKLGAPPFSVFVVHLFICCVAFIVRLFIIRPMISLNIGSFLTHTVLRAMAVVVVSLPLPVLLHNTMLPSFLTTVIVCATSVLVVSASGYLIGLDNGERCFVNDKAKAVFHKLA